MAEFPFPRSSTPGSRPGEGEGRYVNCAQVREGDRSYVRPVHGLETLYVTGHAGIRGMLDVGGSLYVVFPGYVIKVSGSGITTLSGSVPGDDGVTMARNNKTTDGAITPDVVVVRSTGGAYVLTTGSVSAYPDADLPSDVNSVDFKDGYFFFSVPDGRLFASELNSTDVNALSFTTAESRPDGLLRVIAHGSHVYAMGQSTIEPYLNHGLSPFPFQRETSVIPVGLFATMAAVGNEAAWDRALYFIASDGTVRSLSGYDTAVVSTPDVDRFIAAADRSSLEMLVYTREGAAYLAVSSDDKSWVLDVGAGAWHERESTGHTRWRSSRSEYSGNRWILGDRFTGDLMTTSAPMMERGQPLGGMLQSGALKDFPSRIAAAMTAGFTQAETTMRVSWSHDGGGSFGTELERSLSQCDRYPVLVSNLGLSTHHGLIARFRWEGGADFSFSGATAERVSRRPKSGR